MILIAFPGVEVVLSYSQSSAVSPAVSVTPQYPPLVNCRNWTGCEEPGALPAAHGTVLPLGCYTASALGWPWLQSLLGPTPAHDTQLCRSGYYRLPQCSVAFANYLDASTLSPFGVQSQEGESVNARI